MLSYARYQLFRTIEWLTSCLHSSPSRPLQHFIPEDQAPNPDGGYLWVFASTIGELHAIQPLLIKLLARNDFNGMVILTDHPHYTDAFLKAFPSAIILDHGVNGKVAGEIEDYLPSLFVLAEIPCLLSDAPCRFSYHVIYEMKKRDVPVVVVNGWLYGETPSCRSDAIEYALLNKDYMESIDLYTTQNKEVRECLIKAGAKPERVVNTGNLKFDALDDSEEAYRPPLSLQPVLDALKNSGRPCIVAGCITNVSEQEYVLNAFKLIRERIPEALLVLAPRHPENDERMAILSQLLCDRELPFLLRSQFDAHDVNKQSVMILDTLGELKYLYAVSHISFVGLNHNVLEPLRLQKTVFVSKGWEKAYPSYPVYRETKLHDLIIETDGVTNFAELAVASLASTTEEPNSTKNTAETLELLKGATSKNLGLLVAKKII